MLTGRQAVKILRRDSDDGEPAAVQRAIQGKSSANRIGSSAEAPLPERITDHRDGWIELVVTIGQQSPCEWRHAEHFVVIAGDARAIDLFDWPVDADSEIVGCVRRDAGEGFRQRPKALKARIRGRSANRTRARVVQE